MSIEGMNGSGGQCQDCAFYEDLECLLIKHNIAQQGEKRTRYFSNQCDVSCSQPGFFIPSFQPHPHTSWWELEEVREQRGLPVASNE